MSDKFICCRIDRLLTWILEEEKTGYVFGIHKDLFFVPKTSDVFKTERYGHPLETPIGVAAGPHTQLAQNIISAWLTGARTIELKTIQVLDELDVTKPCIDMEDEGYNCEWSQELKLEKSFNEYLNAWILLHVLKDKFGWGDPKIPGFIFNMSVGYNLEGIQSKGVQRFLDKMEDCSREKAEKIDILSDIYPRIRDLDISNCVSDNITVSTMHGCPPDEIEKIGQYFIEKRKLNTIIKLNPTLLGPDRLRDILNNKLGYKIVVPDEAFAHDLKFDAALRLIKNLLASAKKSGVEFGLKLTNTLETENSGQNLPEHEARVYMSGRALHAISVNVAAKLQRSFKGQLDVSFCAGVDCYNVSDVLACNMTPVTICSDLLKPGGYGRLSQYLEEIETSFKLKNTSSIDDHIKSTATSGKETAEAGLENLIKYADDVISNPSLHKDAFPYTTIKTDRELTVFDCTHAPCVSTCPAEQNIPAYIRQTAKGDYQKAHQVILQTNPFPNVLGSVCHHPCQNKCTRMNYDTPLMIREIKRFIACKNRKQTRQTPPPTTGHKAAIIGAGPSGLTCARYLALSGFSVDVFETKAFPGGMASDAIPSYRLDDESLKKDIDSITDLGVKIHYNSQVDKSGFDKIRQTYDFVYIAVGAQDYVKLGIPGEDADGIIDQLSFLSDVRRENRPDIGKKVAVIGGGNSALDAARTAMRLVGKDGEVILLYRRTRKEMPADLEEIKAADNEGVKIIELIAPEEIITENGKVSAIDCSRMTLGEKDASGRPRPVKVENSTQRIEVDCVIPAIGQKTSINFFPEDRLKIDPITSSTQLKNVFAGGDAVHGTSTLVQAIADGRKAAENILASASAAAGKSSLAEEQEIDYSQLQKKLARRQYRSNRPETLTDNPLGFEYVPILFKEEEIKKEANRCLSCDLICTICVTVCPNRANVVYRTRPFDIQCQLAVLKSGKVIIENLDRFQIQQDLQIINIGDFCNECGNCVTFCPTSGSPHETKPKFYLTWEKYQSEENGHFLKGNEIRRKINSEESVLRQVGNMLEYKTEEIKALLETSTLIVKEAVFMTTETNSIDLSEAAEMGVLLRSLKDSFIFIP